MAYSAMCRPDMVRNGGCLWQVMRLRITVESEGAKTRISVAGELVAQGVPELEQVLGANGGCLELDLSDLMFADDDGVATLRRLIDDGAITIGASPFIKKLLAT